jgi:hypothetical protein
MTRQPTHPVSVYLSYAREDEALKQEFEDYLSIMQQGQVISEWIERQIQQGTDWSHVIDPRLRGADLVLVFLSPRLLSSGYCSGAEAREMFERHARGEARVIPIILRNVNLAGSPFASVQSLPRNSVPVSSWPMRDDAWWDIDQELRRVIEYVTRRE